MPVLLIISDRPSVGKTAMAGAVAAELLDRGERVAYIKPFSVGPGPDPDVVYLNELLLSNGSATTPAAQPYDGGNLQSSQMQNIGPAIEQLSAEGQFVLIEGPSLSSLEADQAALLASMVRGVDGKVLLVHGFQHSQTPIPDRSMNKKNRRNTSTGACRSGRTDAFVPFDHLSRDAATLTRRRLYRQHDTDSLP